MDFQDLRAFVQVAQLESFSRAAAQMRIAQSAISRRIQRLEHEFGVELLHRYGRGIQLTAPGEVLLRRCEDLMLVVRQIETEMMSVAKEPHGKITIAFPPATGQLLAPLLVEAFGEKFPKVALYIREGFSSTIQDWLIRGQVDVAILYNPEKSSDLVATELLTEALYVIEPTQKSFTAELLTPEGEIEQKNIFKLPLIMPSKTHSIRLLMDRTATYFGVKPNVIQEADGMPIIKRLVERGLGCTVFNYAGVQAEIVAGTLRAIPIVKPQLTWQFCLVVRKDLQTARALLDLKKMVEAEVRRLVEMGVWRQSPHKAKRASSKRAPAKKKNVD